MGTHRLRAHCCPTACHAYTFFTACLIWYPACSCPCALKSRQDIGMAAGGVEARRVPSRTQHCKNNCNKAALLVRLRTASRGNYKLFVECFFSAGRWRQEITSRGGLGLKWQVMVAEALCVKVVPSCPLLLCLTSLTSRCEGTAKTFCSYFCTFRLRSDGFAVP